MCGRYKLELPFREIVRLYNLTQANASRFDNMPVTTSPPRKMSRWCGSIGRLKSASS